MWYPFLGPTAVGTTERYVRQDRVTPAALPKICINIYLNSLNQSPMFDKPTAKDTAGFKCAPETTAKLYVDIMRVNPRTRGFHSPSFCDSLPSSVQFHANAWNIHPINSAINGEY